MSRVRSFLMTTMLVIIASSFSFFASANQDNQTIDNDLNLGPAEVHQRLASMKAGSLALQRQYKLMTPTVSEVYPQTDYNVSFYDIAITVDVLDQDISGEVTMYAEAVAGSIDTVEVDFYSNMIIDSIHFSGTVLNYIHENDRITIELDRSYAAGESFAVSTAYHGTPVGSGLYGFGFDTNQFGDPIVASLSQPMSARSWWPCKDRPDDKADSLDIAVTCKTDYYCASNGTLADTTRDGSGSWTFDYRVRYPIATYLFSIAVADYEVWTDWYHFNATDSMPIVNHVYPQNLAQSLTSYAIVPEAIGIFSDLFGEYPFLDEKYGHANFEWVGAMEHQTVSSMNGGLFGFNEFVIVHELAHQWWGDMITCRNWHEIWLNEGFATYSEALYYEARDGTQAYHDYIASLFTYFEGRSIYVEDTSHISNIFDAVVYDKAAWFLHMLRHIVGDEDFFAILRAWYNSDAQYASATTDDFKSICESISGLDLEYFFNEWIYGGLRPHYYWSYYTEPAPIDGLYYSYIHLQQGASTQYQTFSMPIDIVTSTAGEPDTTVVFNNCADTVYIFTTDEPADGLELDPGNWILKLEFPEEWSHQQVPFDLDTGEVGTVYLDSIVVKSSGDNIRFALNAGALPPGLELDAITGHIDGTPGQDGTFDFQVRTWETDETVADTADYSITVRSISVDVFNDDDPLPRNFRLAQNHPNPFNSSTAIEFYVPLQSYVTLEIWDILGRRVRTLIDAEHEAGTYVRNWDGTTESGEAVPTGIYLYRLKVGDMTATRKMLLLK